MPSPWRSLWWPRCTAASLLWDPCCRRWVCLLSAHAGPCCSWLCTCRVQKGMRLPSTLPRFVITQSPDAAHCWPSVPH